MAFTPQIAAIKKEIRDRCEMSSEYMTEDIFNDVEKTAKKFYAELPEERIKYSRKYHLTKLLNRTPVTNFGSSFKSSVYYNNDWRYKKSGNSGWSNEKIVRLNMYEHTHGGYYPGTAVWADSVLSLDNGEEWPRIAKDALIAAGLPVK